ncbi:hypothetical protein ACFPK9_04975 [Rubritalea spongiae]|uniref:Uncharacterized protein n=1 Tax=Rubritalea spongiae TaxID=430797 RepID=A0ABW5E892_9BACT
MTPLKFNIKNFEELVACFRSGNAALLLTDLHLDETAYPVEWGCSLIINEDSESSLHIKYSKDIEALEALAPWASGGNIKKYESVTALIDHQLNVAFSPFWIRGASHSAGKSYTASGSFNTCNNLETASNDELSSSSMTALLPETSLRVANDGTKVIRQSSTHGDLGSTSKLDAFIGDVGKEYLIYPNAKH